MYLEYSNKTKCLSFAAYIPSGKADIEQLIHDLLCLGPVTVSATFYHIIALLYYHLFVLVNFLLLGQNIQHPEVKGRKIYFSHRL